MNNYPDSEPSHVNPEIHTELSGPRHLTRSQAKAHEALFSMACLRGQTDEYAGIRLRARPLLVGPSGAGKTAVIRRVCDSLSGAERPFPLLILNSAGWILMGSRSEIPTLGLLRAFVQENACGCILLDELDHLTPVASGWEDSWTCHVVGEVIAFLDTRLEMVGWTKNEIARLKTFFIVGAAAFQHHVVDPKTKSKLSYSARIRNDPGIPPEILLRFSHRHTAISLPDRNDFRASFIRLYRELALPDPKAPDFDKLIDEGVASRAGMRFLEQHLTDLLTRHPKKVRSSPPLPEAEDGRQIVSQGVLAEKHAEFHRLLEDLEPKIAVIRWQFHLHSRRFEVALATDLTEWVPTEKNGVDKHLAGLSDALRLGLGEKSRVARQNVFWKSGHIVAQALLVLLTKETAFLAGENLLTDFSIARAQLKRALNMMEYVASLSAD